VKRWHRGILIRKLAARTAIERPWSAVFLDCVDKAKIFGAVKVSIFTFDACSAVALVLAASTGRVRSR
jgi:hypothetical protein